MPQPRLIHDYLATLAASCPPRSLRNWPTGSPRRYQSYLRLNMPPGPAAESAVAEFGDPH